MARAAEETCMKLRRLGRNGMPSRYTVKPGAGKVFTVTVSRACLESVDYDRWMEASAGRIVRYHTCLKKWKPRGYQKYSSTMRGGPDPPLITFVEIMSWMFFRRQSLGAF